VCTGGFEDSDEDCRTGNASLTITGPPGVTGGFLSSNREADPMGAPARTAASSRRRLEGIRGELAEALGRDLSESEFLELIAQMAHEHRDRLASRASGVHLPLSPEDRARVLSTGRDWGFRTSSADIDRFLYGREPRPSGRRRRRA
jgi:hypothetical protein